MISTNSGGPRVVVVDGCRTPFLRSGTGYRDLMAYDLARMAIAGLLHRNPIDPAKIDQVVMGTVIQDMSTSNLAREAALAAGVPESVPAHTVTMACISSNRAITSAVEAIRSGQAEIVVAGGADTCSDIPIRFRRRFRKRLLATQKYRRPTDWLGFFKGLRFGDLLPEVPRVAEFSTGLTMGQSCDRLTARFGIGRAAQDEFAVRSHRKAAEATEKGVLADDIVPAFVSPRYEPITVDNGFRGDSTVEKLEKLRPSFTRRFGTATAGNSSFLTDGASAVLLMSEERARSLGLTPLAAIGTYAYEGSNSLDELLLGPAVSIPAALDRAGLSFEDLDVVEIHEAFAGAVLVSLACLDSDDFCRDRLGRDGKVGAVDPDRINVHGGSLSLGHPFGATGARLVTTCARRLEAEEGRYGLVSACAAGGLGHAMILERVSG